MGIDAKIVANTVATILVALGGIGWLLQIPRAGTLIAAGIVVYVIQLLSKR